GRVVQKLSYGMRLGKLGPYRPRGGSPFPSKAWPVRGREWFGNCLPERKGGTHENENGADACARNGGNGHGRLSDISRRKLHGCRQASSHNDPDQRLAMVQ